MSAIPLGTEPEKIKVMVGEGASVTALLYSASPKSKRDRANVTVLLGHGAGANQLSGFMRLFASGLAARGFDAMTFNFLYTEQGRRAPDPKARLEACCRAVIDAALKHKKLKGNRLVIGGKSMGGRIASQVAAERTPYSKAKASHEVGEARTEGQIFGTTGDDIAGLVFLGYPLHPPGKPEQSRAQHLKDIRARMLFLQGSRDAFGTPNELRAAIKELHLPATLYVIEGGDHSFKVPKSSPLPQQHVYESAMNEIARWLHD